MTIAAMTIAAMGYHFQVMTRRVLNDSLDTLPNTLPI
jgi:hypothetical protein